LQLSIVKLNGIGHPAATASTVAIVQRGKLFMRRR